MGWWSLPADPSVQIGDGVLDAANDFLERVTALYEDELRRKPTVEELQAVLDSAVRVRADPTLLQDFDEREVVGVSVRTAKRRKRVPYKVGDVFAVPLPGGRYGFGRIYNLDPNWNLVEVFAHVGRSPAFSPAVLRAGRLMPPVAVDVKAAFETGAWKIVHSDPDFAPADIASLRYAMGLPGMYKAVQVNQLAPLGPLTDAEAAKLPRREFKALDGTLADIEQALRARKLL